MRILFEQDRTEMRTYSKLAYSLFLIFSAQRNMLQALESRKNLLDQLVDPSRYDKFTQPAEYSRGSTEVAISVSVEELSSVQASSMDFELDFYLRARWVDPRLRYSESLAMNEGYIITNERVYFDKLWVPDIYIANAKESRVQDVTVPNFMLRISPDGQILCTNRVRATLTCHLRLNKFPVDQQDCPMKLLTFMNTQENGVNVTWEYPDSASNIMLDPDIRLPDFEFVGATAKYCDGEYLTGTYSCLIVWFKLRRFISYHVFQVYVPSATVVIISWISFWMSPRAVPARATLSITTFLALSSQSTGIRSTLPPVSYVTGVDVWFTICVVFIFGALVEFALAYNINERQEKEMLRNGEKIHKIGKNGKVEDAKKESFFESHWLDRICRYLFPSAFGISSVVYWFYYR